MRLEEFVCCPKCKRNLQANAEYYICIECSLKYPIVDGVVDFLPSNSVEKGRGQKLMESEKIVEIYESKWWRGCKFFPLFMKISLDDEIALIKRIAKTGPADRVLDLACGPGVFARPFAVESTDREVIGFDLSWPMLRYATTKAKRCRIENIAFMHGDAHYLPLKDSSIDVANCCGALHIFKDIRQVLSELNRVIKPNGRFSAALCLRSSNPFNRLKASLDEKFWGIHYYREEEFKGLLDEAGFEPTVYHAKGIWMIAGGVCRS